MCTLVWECLVWDNVNFVVEPMNAFLSFSSNLSSPLHAGPQKRWRAFLLPPQDSTLDYKPGRATSCADALSHLQRRDNGVPWGLGMGQVGMMEAGDGRGEFTAERPDQEEVCKIRMGPGRIERGWEAEVKKKLF